MNRNIYIHCYQVICDSCDLLIGRDFAVRTGSFRVSRTRSLCVLEESRSVSFEQDDSVSQTGSSCVTELFFIRGNIVLINNIVKS